MNWYLKMTVIPLGSLASMAILYVSPLGRIIIGSKNSKPNPLFRAASRPTRSINPLVSN